MIRASVACLFALAPLVSGCNSTPPPTPEQIAAYQDAQCRSMGAVPGTDTYVQCRLSLMQMAQQEEAIEEMRRARRDAAFAEFQASTRWRRPMACRTIRFGNTVTTDCY